MIVELILENLRYERPGADYNPYFLIWYKDPNITFLGTDRLQIMHLKPLRAL